MVTLLILGLIALWLQTILFGVYFLYPGAIDLVIARGPRWVWLTLIAILGAAWGGSIWMCVILSESAWRMWG